jgi:hypothetical protein
VELVADPRNPHPREDRLLQQTTALHIYDLLGELTFLTDRAIDLRDQARERADGLKGRDLENMDEFADRLEAFRGTLVVVEGGWISGKEQLRERLGNLYGAVSGYDGRPTQSQLDRLERLEAEFDQRQQAFDALLAEVDGFNERLERRDLEPLAPLTRDQWEADQEGVRGSTSLLASLWMLPLAL